MSATSNSISYSFWGWQLSVPHFGRRGSEKTEYLGEVGVPVRDIAFWGAYYNSCRKRLEGSISNIDIGLL